LTDALNRMLNLAHEFCCRALLLRSRYQSAAVVSSVREAGWNSTFVIQPREQLGADLFPRNCRYLTGVDLTNTTFNLFCPGSFDILIGLIFQALEEQTGKFCPLTLSEF